MFYINRSKKLIYGLFIYMNKVRKLIRETIEKEVINEVAVSFNDIFTNESIGLVQYKGSITLYDFKIDRVYGYMSMRPISSNLNEFVAVAAEKGYGPLIYECGIMASFNKGLLPTRDGDIRGDAFKVWEKFTQRTDVVKAVLEEGDEGYSEEYLDFDLDMDNPKESIVGNTVLVKIPSSEYKKLIVKGKELMSIYKKTEEQVAERGGEFFGYRYADS